MAEVKFYLEKRIDKDTNKLIKENVPILLFFSFNGLRLQHYTGYRIDTSKWDAEKQKVKRNCAEASEINQMLDSLRTKVQEAYFKAKLSNLKPSLDYFREELKGDFSRGKKSFDACLAEYIDSSTHTKTKGTIAQIRTSFNNISNFSKATNTKLEFDNIDLDFYTKFLDYCFNNCDYKNNYTGNLIKDLKSFLNWATENGYNTKLDFRKKSFRKLVEAPEIIFLYYDELIHLYNIKLKDKNLAQVRDVFCFGCFTGMRYSDIARLSSENIQGDQMLYRVLKTGEKNSVPLNPYSKKIIERYQGKFPNSLPVISEQKTNAYLKELAIFSGLKRKVEQIHFQGTKRIKKSSPLHDVITFHTSKKTFMTNFLAKGGSLLTAMAITGNKSFEAAKRYYKVVDTLKADEMKKVFG